MLTLNQLKEMKPNSVFATGFTENSPEGIYMVNHDIGRRMLWVAERGGIEDWAIYIYWAEMGENYVLKRGDKIHKEAHIKKLVPCDGEAFKMYRH